MDRLTTNKEASEMGMLELAYNSCYVKDGMARYRDYDLDIDARELARKLLKDHADSDITFESDEDFDEYIYKATDNLTSGLQKWHPSIHMPKEAARIFLRVTDVRVERLKDIGDCTKEGIAPGTHATAHMNDYDERCDFAALWNSTIPKKDLDKYGWEANPWVWVIEFERVMPE